MPNFFIRGKQCIELKHETENVTRKFVSKTVLYKINQAYSLLNGEKDLKMQCKDVELEQNMNRPIVHHLLSSLQSTKLTSSDFLSAVTRHQLILFIISEVIKNKGCYFFAFRK